MVHVGRIVVGSSWRKTDICGVGGCVRESIRMEVSRDALLL